MLVGTVSLVLTELNSVSCSVEKMQRSVIVLTLNIGMECGKYFVLPLIKARDNVSCIEII